MVLDKFRGNVIGLNMKVHILIAALFIKCSNIDSKGYCSKSYNGSALHFINWTDLIWGINKHNKERYEYYF